MPDHIKKLLTMSTICLFLISLVTSSCTYQERVQPIRLPTAGSNAIEVNGLHISAISFENPEAAEKSFGFDIREAGLLPVQLVFQNKGDKSAILVPEQTFLMDNNNQAWPINTMERTHKRLEDYVTVGETVSGAGTPALLMGAAGAIAGLAVGIVVGEDVGEFVGKGAAIGGAIGAVEGGASAYADTDRKIKKDLEGKVMKNQPILPNQIAYGMLYFPGFPEEANQATSLLLTLSFDGETKSVTINPLPYTQQ